MDATDIVYNRLIMSLDREDLDHNIDIIKTALAEARREERDAARAEVERELQVIKNRALVLEGERDEWRERAIGLEQAIGDLEHERDAARAEAERLRKAAEAVLEHACWFARKTPMAGNAIVSNLPQLRSALDGENDLTPPAATPTRAPRPE